MGRLLHQLVLYIKQLNMRYQYDNEFREENTLELYDSGKKKFRLIIL